ncbi:MAG: Sua5/YciO/YrdC/YwlC family protein [Phycisphaerales bacterium]|nr:Sua5/YciO/YrdC/YwlC family protein [Phycisphaerales bacterium]
MIEACVAAAADGLVVVGTDTIYALATRASPDGLARLFSARLAMQAAPDQSPSTWHAPTADHVFLALPSLTARHRWVMSKLWPGPFTLMLPLLERDALPMRAAGLEPAVVDDTAHVFARVPASGVFSDMLHRAPWPVIAEKLRFGHNDDKGATDLAGALNILERAAIAPGLTLESNAPALGRHSALIRLQRDGSWDLIRASVFDRAYVLRLLTRRVLFVCTGNTCRSPMAQAIASGLWARTSEQGDANSGVEAGYPMVASSAGLHAELGSAPTREGVAAVRALGFAPPSGTAHALTPLMLREADAIYTMTRSHLNAVLKLDPSVAGKASVLDPSGDDIPDPLGGPARHYASLAVAMRDMITRRLQEFGT